VLPHLLRTAGRASLYRISHNAAPDPPAGFAAITAITKLIGPFAQRRTSLIAAAAGRADRDFPPRLS